jgi:metal-responsive CopG/Arc/MetJ family transcriptional regulator
MSDPKRRSAKRQKVTITLPAYLIADVDALVEETEQTRSDVIEAFVDYCLHNSDIIDALFPYEEEDEEEGEEEGESEEETE